MKHTQPSLFEQQVYEPGQQVTVTITGTIESIRSAGHNHVVLAIALPTSRLDHQCIRTYVVVGDPGIEVKTHDRQEGA